MSAVKYSKGVPGPGCYIPSALVGRCGKTIEKESYLALQLLGIGVVAGAFGALFGVGGGVVLVPLLSLVAGLELRAAVGISLISVAATSVAGSAVFLRRGFVTVPTAMKLQFFAVLGATVASLAAPSMPEAPLYFVFALLLVFVAVKMWPRSKRRSPWTDDITDARRRRAGVASALGAGGLAGLLGVGGGDYLHASFALDVSLSLRTGRRDERVHDRNYCICRCCSPSGSW